MTALAKVEPADLALVAFGPLDEVDAVYQRCDAAAFAAYYPTGVHWFQVGDSNGDPLRWTELLGSHVGDAGPHLLTVAGPVTELEPARCDDDYYAAATS